MNIEEVENRYEELYQKAVLLYLDKTDFYVVDWLSKEDILEFNKLQSKINKFYK